MGSEEVAGKVVLRGDSTCESPLHPNKGCSEVGELSSTKTETIILVGPEISNDQQSDEDCQQIVKAEPV